MTPPWTFHFVETVDSTMDEAWRWVQTLSAPRDRNVFYAGSQTKGRGRHGRPWISIPGNLYATLILAGSSLKMQPPLHRLSDLSFLGALALGESLKTLSGLESPESVGYKWPNDVLWSGKKIGGILPELKTFPLSESESQFDEPSETFILLGVGVNLKGSPKELSYPATSLKEEGIASPSPREFLELYIQLFEEKRNAWEEQGFWVLREAWMASTIHSANPWVKIQVAPSTLLEGYFEDIDDQGRLVLKTEGGLRKISAGEVLGS